MKTALLTRLSAFALSATFATIATLGVAMLMTDSGDRAQLAAAHAAPTVLTQLRTAPTL